MNENMERERNKWWVFTWYSGAVSRFVSDCFNHAFIDHLVVVALSGSWPSHLLALCRYHGEDWVGESAISALCSNVLLRVWLTSWHVSLGLILSSDPLKYIFLFFRPLEMSAKKPVPFLRQVVSVTKKVGASPRQFRSWLPLAMLVEHRHGNGAAEDDTGCFWRVGLGPLSGECR